MNSHNMNTPRSAVVGWAVGLAGGLAVTLISAGALSAHGGRYRCGPLPSTTPQPPPTTKPPPAPPKPYVPKLFGFPTGPTGPKTPGGSGRGVPGPKTPGGIPLTTLDMSRWQLWWEMNKDQYLLLKNAVRQAGPVTGADEWFMGYSRRHTAPASLAPTLAKTRDAIIPALHRALKDTNNPDLVTACLIGLAKIGRDHHTFKLLEVFAHYLPAKYQQIRETAALAIGISRRLEALPLLRDLLLDTPRGRLLAQRSEVDSRVRSFAAYGLGILASHGDADLKSEVFAVLSAVLHNEKIWDRDIKVAAISALGVMRLDPLNNSKEKRLLWRLLPSLTKFYAADLGKAGQVVQAHVPVAIGRVLGRGDSAEHARFRELLRGELSGRKRRLNAVYQSAAIALGLLARPKHEEDSDRLHRYYEAGRDAQTRYFSLIAMGQIGGDANRTRLLKALARGKKVLERPWAALGLGVLSYRTRKLPRGMVDKTIGVALTRQLDAVKNKQALGAFAIALGLCGYQQAAPRLRELLAANKNHDELAGHLCIGLALMQDKSSIGGLRAVLHRSVRRPEALRQAAIALGILRDKDAVRHLLDMLADGDRNTARMAAVASALQFVGDHRTVNTLLESLDDDDLTKLSRAFVAAALGGIADPMVLPFNARYAANCNYRAVVDTLSNQATGILDLL